MKPQIPLLASAAVAAAVDHGVPGATSYVVPTAFPTTVYSSYYVNPGPTQEPQPAIFDPVLNITFPLNLTDPSTIPTEDPDPVLFPEPAANLSDIVAEAVIAATIAQVLDIVSANNTGLADSCSKCVAALAVAQVAARLAPSYLPDAMVELCQTTGFNTNATCQSTYEASSFGATWTQVLAKADVAGLDGRYICSSLSTSFCSAPPVIPSKAVFPKEKPAGASVPARSGKTAKVFHLSDMHLDPRYEYGSEASCSSSPCCRPSAPLANGSMPAVALPAPLYGYYSCDSPYYLALAAVQSIGPLTGTSLDDPPAMTFYTGDMVTHVPSQDQLSRAFVEDVEDSVLQMFKAYIGGPIYVALGNHDSSPENNDAPHAIDNDGPLGNQFSWNYDHVSKLWEHYGWINGTTQAEAALHYGAYAVTHPLGVRIITLNGDFYYKSNYYAFLHTSEPDYSGMFSFLIDELQKAEDAGQRAYIVSHVLTGWDGSNPMPNTADYFYQIVERYSPHVIANIFFGHTHEDQAFVFYANNGTSQTSANALTNAWVGPSLTPLTNLNSGYRMYEIDTGSFEVMDAYTFYSDVNSFGSLDGTGPVWQFEYSTREAYGGAAGWPAEAPLNATFWHAVTEAMERNRTLVTLQNQYQGKSSVKSPNCTNQACQDARKPPAIHSSLLVAPETPSVDESSRNDTSPAAASSSSQSSNDVDTDRPASASSKERSSATARGSPWNPFARYWSSRNITPDYGSPQQSTVDSLKKGIMTKLRSLGAIVPTNTLNGRSRPSETTTTTTKRSNEPYFSRPPKRVRTSESSAQNILPYDGLDDVEEPALAHTPTPKKGKPTQQSAVISLESSADRRSSKGNEQQEFRKTEHTFGIKQQKPRSRHHKKDHNDVSRERSDQDSRAISSSHMSFSRRPGARLISLQEATDSNDEITGLGNSGFGMKTTAAVKSSRPRTNGSVRTSSFTSATFKPADHQISDDELASTQVQARPKQKDKLTTSFAPAKKFFANGTKRPAESIEEFPNKQSKCNQDGPSSMRNSRRQSVSKHASTAPHTRLQVYSAVCEPKFFTPDFATQNNTRRASVGRLYLTPTTQGTKIDGLRVVDADGNSISGMEWLAPNPEKITRLVVNNRKALCLVGTRKSPEDRAASARQSELFIAFGNPKDTDEFIGWCRQANPSILKSDDVTNRLESSLTKLIRERNKGGSASKQLNTDRSVEDDAKLLGRLDVMGHWHERSKPRVIQPQTQGSGHFSAAKAHRTQNRAEQDGDGRQIKPMKDSRGLTAQTAAEERHILEVVGGGDDDSHGEELKVSGTCRRIPADVDGSDVTSQSHRTLRSAKATTPIPSPDIERWSETNTNWMQEHNWKMPLVYERTTVDAPDILRLDEGQYLNDEIISFYAKYLHKQLEQRDAELAKKVYVFNSFFFETLKGKGYEGVKSWTAKIDLFSHDYIVVPINQAAHWYVAIICNPRGLLPHDEEPPTEDTADLQTEETSAAHDKADDVQPLDVTSDIAQTGDRDQPDGETVVDLEEVKQSTSTRKPKRKKSAIRKKYDPKEPRVITLDSLEGSHSGVASALKTYLAKEIKRTTGVDIETPTSFGTAAKDIPVQPNWTDCGIYLLGYLEEFMKDPHRFTSNILQHVKPDWDVNAPALRNKIRDLILQLQKEYQKAEHQRRQGKQRAKKSMSRPSSAEAEASSSKNASEQLRSSQPPPSSASPAPNSRHQTPAKVLTGSKNHTNGQTQLGEPASRSSVSPAPDQEAQADSGITIVGSPESICDKGHNPSVSVSMIVNLNDSIEIPDARAMATRPASTPPAVRPVGKARLEQTDAPVINRSKTPTQAAAADEYDERMFLKPISSSPPSRASSRRIRGSHDSSPSAASPAKRITPVQDKTSSHFFANSAAKKTQRGKSSRPQVTPRGTARSDNYYFSSVLKSAAAKNPTRSDEDPEYTILSDDDTKPELRSSAKSAFKAKIADTIDLTDD